jgi:biotin carboxylase
VTHAAVLRADNTVAVNFSLTAESLHRKRWEAAIAERRFTVLLVASLISLPYRVMRTVEATGADIVVLGGAASRGLRYSRYCRKFIPLEREVTGERDPDLARDINRAVGAHGIDMVLPADATATRALLAVKDLIDAPCFPSPSLRQFDYLNDKWHFYNLCLALGIPVPPSQLVADAAQLRAKLEAGAIALPAIAKPVNHDGGLGVLKLESDTALSQVARIDYGPVVVQNYIEGEDLSASVYCRDGRITHFIAHQLKRSTYRTVEDPRIRPALARIMAHMGTSGVYNFDMRLTPDGKLFFLECNPRFFFSMNLALAAGVNFVRQGLTGVAGPREPSPGTAVRKPKALALALLRPWTVRRRDLGMLWHLWSDPISQLRELFGIDWEKPGHVRHFPTPIEDEFTALEPELRSDDRLAPAALERAA